MKPSSSTDEMQATVDHTNASKNDETDNSWYDNIFSDSAFPSSYSHRPFAGVEESSRQIAISDGTTESTRG